MTVNCVPVSQSDSAWFTIESGIHQKCVLCVGTRLLSQVQTGCWKELLAQAWMECHLSISLWVSLILRSGFC